MKKIFFLTLVAMFTLGAAGFAQQQPPVKQNSGTCPYNGICPYNGTCPYKGTCPYIGNCPNKANGVCQYKQGNRAGGYGQRGMCMRRQLQQRQLQQQPQAPQQQLPATTQQPQRKS